MSDLSKPIAPSSFYLEFDSLTELVFKSIKLPDYKPKVQGKDAAFGSTKGGKAIRQINSSGFEGLFSFECVCVASGTASSASKKMYGWFEQCLPASAGGKGKFDGSKKSGAITAYDNDGKEVAKWEFAEAWPSKYKCADLEAAGDTYLDETFTITCEKFNRTK